MAVQVSLRHVEAVVDGVLIEFSDGRLALFPTDLLANLSPCFEIEQLRDLDLEDA